MQFKNKKKLLKYIKLVLESPDPPASISLFLEFAGYRLVLTVCSLMSMAGVEEMRQEMVSMRDFLIKQSREILKLKRTANGHHNNQEEDEDEDAYDFESGQARLNYIEHQVQEREGP